MKEEISNKWGITAMICGILSLVLILAPYFGLPLAVLAVIFASLQKPKTGASNTGMVTGIIGIVLNFIIGMICLLFLSAMSIL